MKLGQKVLQSDRKGNKYLLFRYFIVKEPENVLKTDILLKSALEVKFDLYFGFGPTLIFL